LKRTPSYDESDRCGEDPSCEAPATCVVRGPLPADGQPRRLSNAIPPKSWAPIQRDDTGTGNATKILSEDKEHWRAHRASKEKSLMT